MKALTDEYQALRTKALHRIGKFAQLREQLKEKQAQLGTLETAEHLHGEECDVLRIVGELQQRRTTERVENLGTMALQSVFKRPDYKFVLLMEHKKNQMTAVPMLVTKFKGTEIIIPVDDAKGGGIGDVVSFVMRVIVHTLTRPRLAKTMWLDEPFRDVSRQHLPAVGALLRKLIEVTGVQFNMVTHKTEFAEAADKAFTLAQDSEGVTVVTESGGVE